MAQRLCTIDDVAESGTEFRVPEGGDTRYLVLFRRGADVLGYENVCPHQGRPLNFMPDRFLFTRDGWLMCPHHGACFDVATGACVEGPCRGTPLTRVTLERRGDEIWLADPGLSTTASPG